MLLGAHICQHPLYVSIRQHADVSIRQHADVCCDAARRPHVSERALSTLCSMLSALCSLLYVLCSSMMYAVCCMLYALDRRNPTHVRSPHLHVCFLLSLLYHAFSYSRMRHQATSACGLTFSYMRPQVTRVCGLKLLVYAASSYSRMRPQATRVCGLKLLSSSRHRRSRESSDSARQPTTSILFVPPPHFRKPSPIPVIVLGSLLAAFDLFLRCRWRARLCCCCCCCCCGLGRLRTSIIPVIFLGALA
jgi:hypothetical protein